MNEHQLDDLEAALSIWVYILLAASIVAVVLALRVALDVPEPIPLPTGPGYEVCTSAGC